MFMVYIGRYISLALFAVFLSMTDNREFIHRQSLLSRDVLAPSSKIDTIISRLPQQAAGLSQKRERILRLLQGKIYVFGGITMNEHWNEDQNTRAFTLAEEAEILRSNGIIPEFQYPNIFILDQSRLDCMVLGGSDEDLESDIKNSIHAIQAFREKNPDAVVAIGNISPNDDYIASALTSGADILIATSLLAKEVILAIHMQSPDTVIISGAENIQEAADALAHGADGVKITPLAATDVLLLENYDLLKKLKMRYPDRLIGYAGSVTHNNISRIIQQGDINFIGKEINAVTKKTLQHQISWLRDSASTLCEQRIYSYPAGGEMMAIRVANPNKNYCRTTSGAVSVGVSMQTRLLYPDKRDYPSIIIAPHDSWIGSDGSNLMQIYFSIACNFRFHGRKTKIVCRSDQKERIVQYLKLGNPYYLPNPEKYLSKNFIRRFLLEAIYLADRAKINNETHMATPYPDMVEFVEFSQDHQVYFDDVCIQDQGNGFFEVIDRGKGSAAWIQGKEERFTLDGRHMRDLDVSFYGVPPCQEIPESGVTFLGTSSGMDHNGLSSNQIIWAGETYVLIDIGPSTIAALQALGLTPAYLSHVVITHMHEDHCAGILKYFQWCKEHGHPIRLVMEPGIYALLKEQMKTILNDELEKVYSIEYIPLRFYRGLCLGKGREKVVIEAIPAFHGTPTTMLRVTYKGHTISHSSDHTFDPKRFETLTMAFKDKALPEHIREDLMRCAQIEDHEKIMDQARVEELNTFLFQPNKHQKKPAIVIYEGGNSAKVGENTSNHTSPYDLAQSVSAEDQKRIIVNHTKQLPPGDFLFHHAKPFSTMTVIPARTKTVKTPSLFRSFSLGSFLSFLWHGEKQSLGSV